MGDKTEALKSFAEFKNPPSDFSICGRIEDDGIQKLAKLKGLKRLDLFPMYLTETLTDASIPHFTKMEKLQHLRIMGLFSFSGEGKAKITEGLPTCHVEIIGNQVKGAE